MLVAGHEEHLGLAVADDELPLLGVLRLVHGHERRAEAVAGVGGDGPLDTVVRDDGDVVAALHAERREPGPELVDQRAELAVGDPCPAPVPLRAEELATRVLLEGLPEQLDEGLEARLEMHGRTVTTGPRSAQAHVRRSAKLPAPP